MIPFRVGYVLALIGAVFASAANAAQDPAEAQIRRLGNGGQRGLRRQRPAGLFRLLRR